MDLRILNLNESQREKWGQDDGAKDIKKLGHKQVANKQIQLAHDVNFCATNAVRPLYCSKNVITSRISGSDKYQRVILVVQWGECSPVVEGIMKVLAPSGLSR